jgi:hypothetical protein
MPPKDLSIPDAVNTGFGGLTIKRPIGMPHFAVARKQPQVGKMEGIG